MTHRHLEGFLEDMAFEQSDEGQAGSSLGPGEGCSVDLPSGGRVV